ncbi:MAG: hypothetical protein L3K10_05790 [Thermoplasmata archaeon]|nr:hypothetical protein [Thermoplasmata archaeon]
MTNVLARVRRGPGWGRAALPVIALAALFAISGVPLLGASAHGAPVPASHVSTASVPASPSPLALRTPALPHATAPAVPASVRGPTPGERGSAGPGGPASQLPPPSPPPSSGRGVFFTSTTVPLPVNATPQGGAFGPRVNDTSSPSIAVTPNGVALLAYTAYTNDSPCAQSRPFALTEVGLVISLNNGSSWSTPTYLGNPDCTQAFNYTSAWQPTLAVLANGTFALAYIEFNASFASFCPACLPGSVYPYEFFYDRLVLTYSYNDGTTWTAPVAVNSSANPTLNQRSALPELPQLAATGQTLYLLWENYSNPQFYYEPSVGLNMVVSTDGGATWGSPISFPVQVGSFFGELFYADNNPNVLITPTGELLVAYTTNYSETAPPFCQPYACTPDYWYTLNVVVASSTNNGSTLHVHTVASSVPWQQDNPGYSFVNVAPQLAYDAGSGKLYVAYEGEFFATSCYTYPLFSGCYSVGDTAPWISVSSNLGTTWSAPRAVSFALANPYGGTYNGNTNLAIAVNSTGAVFVSDLFTNASQCFTTLFSRTCGLTTEVVLTSTDHGTTFTGPYIVNTDGTPGSFYWQGLTSVFTTLAGNLTLAWTNPTCPGWYTITSCYWAGGDGFANVTLSQEFTGAGVTVTFNETGLSPGFNWTVILTGNARSGPAGTNLTVSGVPAGPTELWTVTWVNTTYGHAFGVVVTPSSPGPITGATVIHVTYDPYVLLNVFTVPPAQSGHPFGCALNSFFSAECGNQLVSPTPAAHWVPTGGLLVYSVTPVPFSSYCDYCYNYSFLSWSGSGLGSWNSTNPNGSATIGGPVNETASFNFLSTCTRFFGPITCTNATYDYYFQETGLPANTTWSVTLAGQTVTGNTAILALAAGQGPYNFTIWNVPDGPTRSWVGTASAPSPITSAQGSAEQVHFALVSDSSLSSAVTFAARGLPAGVTSWSLDLNGTSFGIPLANASFVLTNGTYTLNANDVYGANGIGAYVTDFSVVPYVLNQSAFSVLPGGSANLTGPALVTAIFASEYFVTVSASGGGSVTPATVGWVHSGNEVNLTATPLATFAFVGWTGTGAGSTTATTPTISLHPTGAVTELATFAAVTPTYTLVVSSSGVRVGVPVTVTVGTQTYTELTPFNVAGLLAGPYALSVPTVYPNGTVGVRYDPTSVSSSLPLSGGTLHVTANGTLTIGYAVSYALTVTPAVNGTTSPGIGTYWELGGTPVALTATAIAHHSFAGWVGLGPGSVSGPSASISVTPTGAVTESAYFSTNATIPPAVYTVTVSETGLPAGVSWSASIGSYGVSGPAGATSSTLVLSGLNGSYAVSVPIVAGATGVRYFPTYNGNVSVTTHNGSVSVTFATQYEVNVAPSEGGTATSSAQWVASGATVTLTATASATYVFVRWNGTGTGSYSGTNPTATVTVGGPVTELATFVPASSVAPPTGSSNGGGSWLVPIALLVVLLVVGLIVGLVLGRAGGGGRPPAASEEETEETEPTADTSNVPQWNEESEPTSSSPPPSGGGEDESVYGGGSG